MNTAPTWQNIASTITELTKQTGLDENTAKTRLAKFGLNELPKKKSRGILKLLWDIFSEPMMALILITAGIYLFHDTTEAAIILLSVIPIGLMEFFQERRTDNALHALNKMSTQFCRVARGDSWQHIDTKYLVPGDVVHIIAGDRIPADGILINSSGLMVDESILTGEANAVSKNALSAHDQKINDYNFLSQAALIIQGEGQMAITATGAQTEYGKVGQMLNEIEPARTPLQVKIHKLVRALAIAALISATATAIVVGVRQDLITGLLSGLTLAMSLIPEEFPVVFSVFLILGMMRLAQKKALVRQMTMVETLGSATVICTDKTGTLTTGVMKLEKIWWQNKLYEREDFIKNRELLLPFFETALLALEQIAVDPIETETQQAAKLLGVETDEYFRKFELISDLPFDSKTKMVHHIWRQPNMDILTQYTSGAPEAVIACCALEDAEKNRLLHEFSRLADTGYRIVGLASRELKSAGATVQNELNFVGFLIMSDSLRAGVKEAIATCQTAGVRIIMVTGDNKLTAHNVAENLKMRHQEEILSGDELSAMNFDQLRVAVRNHDIFARIKPEQKLQIVAALQANGEVVAMTGDGVNDAPALKKANIGVAMGERGTEVARAAAGIVLLDDNFSTIVYAFKEGRRIYDNLRRAFIFLLSFHLPIVSLALIPLAMGQPMIFLPIHIIFLELICDPTAVLGFEREPARRQLLNEPPRPASEPLINYRYFWQIIFQGLAILGVSFSFYLWALFKANLELANTLAFVSLVISQTFLILFTREWHQIKNNRLLLLISIGTLLSIIAIVTIPPIRMIFHLTSVTWPQVTCLLVIPLTAMSLVSLIIVKISPTNQKSDKATIHIDI